MLCLVKRVCMTILHMCIAVGECAIGTFSFCDLWIYQQKFGAICTSMITNMANWDIVIWSFVLITALGCWASAESQAPTHASMQRSQDVVIMLFMDFRSLIFRGTLRVGRVLHPFYFVHVLGSRYDSVMLPTPINSAEPQYYDWREWRCIIWKPQYVRRRRYPRKNCHN